MKPNKMIAWLLVLTQLAGCAEPGPPAFQAGQDLAARHAAIRKIGVIVNAHVNYSSLLSDVGASDEAKSAELSEQGLKNVQDALNRELGAQGYTVVALPMDDDAHALIAQFQAARGDNIKHPFPDAGEVIAGLAPFPAAAALAAKHGVDAIVLIDGRDSKKSASALVLTAVAYTVVVILVVAIVSPLGPRGKPGPAPYDAEFALIDRSGKLLAYERGNMDVLNTQSVNAANAHFSNELRQAPQH